MSRNRVLWYDYAINLVILIVISAVLVLGFWFHSEFSRFGLIILIGTGGLASLIIIIVGFRTLSFKPIVRIHDGESIDFSEKAKNAILEGEKRAHILPEDYKPRPEINKYRTAVSEGKKFAVLLITDVRKTYISDISAGELAAAGFANPDEFRQHIERKGKYPPYSVVIIIRFEAETHTGGK